MYKYRATPNGYHQKQNKHKRHNRTDEGRERHAIQSIILCKLIDNTILFVTGVEVSTGFVFPLSTQVLGYWTNYVKLREYKQDVYFKDTYMVEHKFT